MMLVSLFYTLLAVLALSFLIFIHELGHYWMARRVGMRVETFAIGFGKPIYMWERDGVKWQIGWLPFGGYVKIAGTDSDKENPYDVPDGFYGKGPWSRIKVAFMGPFVNLIFALLIFTGLWALGGREQNFSEVTNKIGWVDPHSELFALGVRPGDEIVSYNGAAYSGIKDHLYAAIAGGDEVIVKGNHHDYITQQMTPFEYKVKPYLQDGSLSTGRKTLGVMSPASYIIYGATPGSNSDSLLAGSPLKDSGILPEDRIVWMDGFEIFSPLQLENVLNDGRALLTVQRQNAIILVRVPRIHADELKFDANFREELIDWQFEAQLNKVKTSQLYTIPYNLSNEAIVEGELKFIDRDKQAEAFARHPFAAIDDPLQVGDKIIAIDGKPISKAYQLLEHLQQHSVNIIVERNPTALQKVSSKEVDADFDKDVDLEVVNKMASTIGTDHPVSKMGNFVLLKSVTPKSVGEFIDLQERKTPLANEMQSIRKEIESLEDPEKRSQMLQRLEQQQSRLLLGFSYHDRKVDYNPSGVELFNSVLHEIGRTLSSLLTGSLSPKWLSGPVGIVQVVHDNWMVSAKEALFWIGAISLNLGILNLLPIPVLDGGTILISFIELITKRKMQPRTLERLVVPFAILLIVFFVIVTYNDFLRIFSRWWT